MGYRTDEIENIQDNEFFITYGCSHTEGVGLAEDEIWVSNVERSLNLKCLNYGYGGTGPDLQMINSMCFLKNTSKRPKFVLVQWPELTRTLFFRDIPLFLGPRFSNINAQITNFYNAYISENNDINRSTAAIYTTTLMWNLASIPIYSFSLQDGYNHIEFVKRYQQSSVEYNYIYKDIHKARDASHFGPIYHRLLSEWVINEFQLGAK